MNALPAVDNNRRRVAPVLVANADVPLPFVEVNGSKKCRAFPFTINNYTQEEFGLLQALSDANSRSAVGVRYLIFAPEVGEQGTPHLQGFIYFENPRTLRGAHGVPGFARAAMFTMSAFATVEDNVRYVMKTRVSDAVPNAEVFEYGEKPAQGKRKDLSEACELLIASDYNIKKVASTCPEQFVKFYRGFQALTSVLNSRVRNWKTKVIWLYGSTGTGKSRAVQELSVFADLYYKDCHSNWWDGYLTEPICVLDDYRPDMSTFTAVLQLFDRYPLRLNQKGSSTQCLFQFIFVTAPTTPRELWASRTEEQLGQLERRIEHVIKFPLSVIDVILWNSIVTNVRTQLIPPIEEVENVAAVAMNGATNALVLDEHVDFDL